MLRTNLPNFVRENKLFSKDGGDVGDIFKETSQPNISNKLPKLSGLSQIIVSMLNVCASSLLPSF